MVLSDPVNLIIVSASRVSIPRMHTIFQGAISGVFRALGLSRQIVHHFVKVFILFHHSLFYFHLCDDFWIRLIFVGEAFASLFFANPVHLLFHPALERVASLLAALRGSKLARKHFEGTVAASLIVPIANLRKVQTYVGVILKTFLLYKHWRLPDRRRTCP